MGTFRVTQDVEVTSLSETEASVIATQPLPLGERVLLEFTEQRGTDATARLVRTVKNRFVLKNGRLRREIQLSMIDPSHVPDPTEAVDLATPIPAPCMAIVSRRLPVRLIEASSSGCLWDAPVPLQEGNVGFVEVRVSGRHHTEAVRIVRTYSAVGSRWPYRMAAEFLTVAPLSLESLRGVATIVATGVPSAHTP